MALEDRLKKIYEIIGTSNIYVWNGGDDFDVVVMIGDVLDWYYQQDISVEVLDGGITIRGLTVLKIESLRNFKRKPIDDQDDECIEFIYNLLKND